MGNLRPGRREPQEGEDEMGKRFAIVIGVAALGAAVMAASASANFKSVHDPRGDTKCLHSLGGHKPCGDSKRRSADIVRATAGHDGALLKHTIRVAGKFKSLAYLEFDTDSDSSCEFFLDAIRGVGRDEVRECVDRGVGRVTGHARYDFHRHSVEISFSETSIGNPQSYGWRAQIDVGGLHADALDLVPNMGAYSQHQLGDSGVAAAGVIALGVQTAAAATYDTRVTISQEGSAATGLLHGDLYSAARKCEVGRRVVVFKQQPGTDRKLGVGDFGHGGPNHWDLLFRAEGKQGWHVYALVRREVRRHGLVCRSDRSRILTVK
jgi:hypothetical protein